jgi:3-oxoacyl-[acyl-carrier protein] reductase
LTCAGANQILSSAKGAAQRSCRHWSAAQQSPVLRDHSQGQKEFDMPTLNNKSALVTGGSRGIGAAIAKRLAAEGANVAITYAKGAEAAASVVKEIERTGRKAIAIQADAADAAAVKNAVEKTVATFGGLDVLVNNAGTAIPMPVEETTLADFDRVFAIND